MLAKLFGIYYIKNIQKGIDKNKNYMQNKIMEHYKYIDEEINVSRIIYGEFDEEYYCIRTVFEENNQLFTTNFVNNDEYILPEKSYVDDKEYLGEKISENEFNEKWKKALEPFIEKWNEIKNKYIIQKKITTKINCIYPQGIIFNIGEMFHGIADYVECETKYGSRNLYTGNKMEMEMEIIGYDDDNMWIKLKPNNI
jgi:hypothetical protein